MNKSNTHAALQARVEELERKLGESEQIVRSLVSAEIDTILHPAGSTPLLLLAAQAQLLKNEQLFRAVFDGAMDALLIADDSGCYVDANPAACLLFGLPREQLLGRTIVQCGDSTFGGAGAWAQFLLVGRIEGQFRMLRSDGSERDIDFHATSKILPGLHLSVLRDMTERRRAESRFRTMIERSHDGIGLVDATGETLYASPAIARMLGRPAPDRQSAHKLEFVHADDRAGLREGLLRLLAHPSTPVSNEFRVLRSDGSTCWVAATASNFLDDPAIAAVVGNFQDITQRKAAEAALRAMDLRYRRIVDNTLEGVWMYDADGKTIFMNPRMAEMLGCSVEEALGKPIFSFIHESLRDAARERVARRKLGDTERGDFQLRRRDGSDLWVSIHANPLFDETGKFESSLALLTDITDRRRADETRNRLASIVASSDDAIISRGVDGLIRTWNRGAEKLTQYSAEEAVGQPITLLYPPEHAVQLSSVRKLVDDGQRLQQFEMVCLRKDGSHVEVAITASVLVDDTDAIQGVSIIARDITERVKSEAALRRSEEQLRQAQKMEAVGSLAGGVAHDFNNLLSVILSYTSLIIEELKPADPLRNDIEQVHKAGMRATELTTQLLAFSRHQMLQPIVLDLNTIVSNIEKMLGRLLREDIQLSLLPAALPVHISADAGQIEQVITNLVVNARDAMPNGGSLTIETALVMLDERHTAEHVGVVAGPYVSLAVTDTGTGMDAATQERIFEPFFTTKDVNKGTGLGLSTVYGIVQQSGGHIHVDSKLGQGTTFTIYLPQSDRRLSSDIPVAIPLSTLRGTETILLVEDEEQVLTVMRAILHKHGYHVLDARNGGEAFLICEQYAGAIDLLLTDVVMPRMSGRQLAERLLTLRPALKVLYVSGYMEDATVHHGRAAGGIGFLRKPVLPATLLEKIRLLLDSSSAHSAGTVAPEPSA